VSNPSQYFIEIQNAGLLGFTTILSASIALGFSGKLRLVEKIIFGIVMCGFLLSVPISLPLWNTKLFSSLVQFPYRFLILPLVFGPWIVAFVIEQVSGWKRSALVCIFLVLWFIGVYSQLGNIQFVHRLDGYYTTNEATTNVANEYMPRWVSDVPIRRAVDTLEIIDGDAELTSRTFSGEKFAVKVDAKETSILQINKIYYPGWGVTIDNTLVPINYQNHLGVIRVEVPKGSHVVKAEFRETPFRFFADVVSFVSFIIFLFWIQPIKKIWYVYFQTKRVLK
jgi:hypothetical protein